jgi:hypothetical protein
MGLDPNQHYDGSCRWGSVEGGQFKVSAPMQPWSADVVEIQAQ